MVESSAGRFAELEHLGTGGMASVYRALDQHRGSSVALKRLRPDLRESVREDLRELFHREYRMLCELAHPRIIEVYDYGVDEEGPYYTMELLEGSDLRSKMPVPWREACGIARDVCSSLALLHSRGYVHRDISPANVWLTSSGEAKLLDFGAMAPMGVCKMLVGNPACVAPEAMMQQPLDGRSDLFSLGATLYWALTGRRAFSAKSFSDLRALNRELPSRPATLVEEIPAALDRLVMSLMSLDATARPRSAAEVIERLTAVAKLPELESEAVPRSYLTVPALVGRDDQLQAFRQRTQRLMSGRGGAVRLAGAAGMGRSRMLDACVLEAKLAGAHVLRASSSDAAEGPYGVLRALASELPSQLSERLRAFGEDGVELAALVDGGPIPDDSASRPLLHRALLAYMHEAGRGHGPFVLAVDDFAQCDEPSQAALLALAHESRRRPVMVLYTDEEAEEAFGDPTPASTMGRIAFDIELPPLGVSELKQLLTAVFGDVPNLPIVAQYVAPRVQGSPRVCMELAQALVDRELARYAKGSWSLPGSLDEIALPDTLSARRREKLRTLDEDAREAADVLALGRRHVAARDRLAAACTHGDRQRTEAALDALLQVGVVRRQGDRVDLADAVWGDLLCEEVSLPRKRTIHARLARLLEQEEADVLWRVECLLEAGEKEAGVALLNEELAAASRVEDAPVDYVPLLQRSVEACTRLGSPPAQRYPILREIARLSLKVTIPGMREVFRELLGYLTHDSGLGDWHALTDVEDESARLHQALEAAQARADAGRATVLAPREALRELVLTVYEGSVNATAGADSQIMRSLPSLAPMAALSPAIDAVENSVRAQRAVLGARFEEATELFKERLRVVESPDRGGYDEAQAQRSWFLINYTLGVLHAGRALEGALAYADRLGEYEQGHIPAALIRHMYYQGIGNMSEAGRWGRRAELLQVQQKRSHALAFSALRYRIERAAVFGDLPTVVRALKVLEDAADRYPAFVPYVHYGRAVREQLRGNFEASVQESRKALAQAEPGEDIVWPWAAHAEVESLRLMGALDEAKRRAEAYDATAERVGLGMMRLDLALAMVEAQRGEFDRAMQRLNEGVAYRERLGMRGGQMGRCYEYRARVALWNQDLDQFHEDAQRCAAHYKEGRDNPALAARYEQLVQEAQSGGVGIMDMPLERVAHGDTTHNSRLTEHAERMVSEAMSACDSRQERAETALRLLRETAGAEAGWLYLLRESGEAELVANDAAEPADVHTLAIRLLDLECCGDLSSSPSDHTEPVSDVARTSGDDEHTSATSAHAPRGVVLSFTLGKQLQVAGAVIFRSFGRNTFMDDVYAVAASVSRMLAEAGDTELRKLG